LVSGDAKRETPIQSLKENLMLMLGYIITLMDTGHPGTLDITDTEDTDLVFGDARREMPILNQKESLMLMPGYTTTHTDTGHHGTQDIMDMEDMALVFGGENNLILLWLPPLLSLPEI